MDASLQQLAALTAQYERDLKSAQKKMGIDPLLVSCLGLSNLTLDLIWSLQWLDTLTDRLGDDHMVKEFMDDLNERCKSSTTLQRSAEEAKLL